MAPALLLSRYHEMMSCSSMDRMNQPALGNIMIPYYYQLFTISPSIVAVL